MKIETASFFDIFINIRSKPSYSLSSSKPRKDTQYFWVPIEEVEPWGYEPFFRTKQILDRAYADGKKAYIHCFAGSNRSPSMAMAWLTSRGHTLGEAARIVAHEKAQVFVDKFNLRIEEGCIPKDLPEFYRRYNEFGPKPLEFLLKNPCEIKD